MNYLLVIIFTLFSLSTYADELRTVISTNDREPLPYAIVKVKGKRIGLLADSLGRVSLKDSRLKDTDSLKITYIGYKDEIICLSSVKDTIFMENKASELSEVTIWPGKYKKKTKGKKHKTGLFKSILQDSIAGECYGYEFHAGKGKELILTKVGFYYLGHPRQMTRMRFRVNVYDMSKVVKAPTRDFQNVLTCPILFEFILPEKGDGKFIFSLPNPIKLPRDAMVEIEFLENLNNEIFMFKSNLFGKKVWGKSVMDGYWDQDPFASPFFIECHEFNNSDSLNN